MDLISLIIPCYNEEETLPLFYEESLKVARDMEQFQVDFEWIFIDDGSKDGTLDVLVQLALADNRVHYISFSRNFGKEAAMLAGLKKAKGDFVTTIDVDLQDPPELLKEMYRMIKREGFDCVGTRRVSREGEPPVRSFFADMFYCVINKISDIEIVNGARDYRLMTRQMADSILSMPEYNRFSKGIFSFVGYRTKWLEYKNIERVAGQTSWSFFKLFKYSLEGIVAFSTTPLYIASIVGILLCLISIAMILLVIVKTLVWGDPVTGYPSLICIIFFLGGIQLFTTGILGQYIAKMYLETKMRPHFFVKDER